METSTDLQQWTTDGVTFADYRDLRVANVPRDAPQRFLRLRVEDCVGHALQQPVEHQRFLRLRVED